MPLIRKLENMTIADVYQALTEAQRFLASRCAEHMKKPLPITSSWGTRIKRRLVGLPREGRPSVIDKDNEQLSEIINMVATVERLLGALGWFRERREFRNLRVKTCHPTTSSAPGENDLVLAGLAGEVVVRCEVFDVISASASQNGKERGTLRSLGCEDRVPVDGVRRFLCTSREFAEAISAPRRRWAKRPYRYQSEACGDDGDTVLLEVLAAPGDYSVNAELHSPEAEFHQPRGMDGEG